MSPSYPRPQRPRPPVALATPRPLPPLLLAHITGQNQIMMRLVATCSTPAGRAQVAGQNALAANARAVPETRAAIGAGGELHALKTVCSSCARSKRAALLQLLVPRHDGAAKGPQRARLRRQMTSSLRQVRDVLLARSRQQPRAGLVLGMVRRAGASRAYRRAVRGRAGGRGRGRGRASRLPWARATRIDFGTHKFCEPLNKEGGWITPPMQMFGHVLGKLRNNRVGCGLTPNEKRDSSQF